MRDFYTTKDAANCIEIIKGDDVIHLGSDCNTKAFDLQSQVSSFSTSNGGTWSGAIAYLSYPLRWKKVNFDSSYKIDHTPVMHSPALPSRTRFYPIAQIILARQSWKSILKHIGHGDCQDVFPPSSLNQWIGVFGNFFAQPFHIEIGVQMKFYTIIMRLLVDPQSSVQSMSFRYWVFACHQHHQIGKREKDWRKAFGQTRRKERINRSIVVWVCVGIHCSNRFTYFVSNRFIALLTNGDGAWGSISAWEKVYFALRLKGKVGGWEHNTSKPVYLFTCFFCPGCGPAPNWFGITAFVLESTISAVFVSILRKPCLISFSP